MATKVLNVFHHNPITHELQNYIKTCTYIPEVSVSYKGTKLTFTIEDGTVWSGIISKTNPDIILCTRNPAVKILYTATAAAKHNNTTIKWRLQINKKVKEYSRRYRETLRSTTKGRIIIALTGRYSLQQHEITPDIITLYAAIQRAHGLTYKRRSKCQTQAQSQPQLT